MRSIQLICLVLYYGIFRHLPATNVRVGIWARPLRRWVCHPLFKYAGKNINIEKGASLVKAPTLRLAITPASALIVNYGVMSKSAIML